MTPDRLVRLLEGLRGRTITVFGDAMLDEYIWGDVSRISPDAPVQVVEVQRRSRAIGGAANVASNLAAAGAGVRLVAAIGDDEAGLALAGGVRSAGVDASGMIAVPGRPTTVKTRVIACGQHLLRLDDEERGSLPPDAGERLSRALDIAIEGAHAVLVSDYAKGVVTRNSMAHVARRATARGIPVVVDPKASDLSTYRGATAITPNRREAESGSGLALTDPDAIEDAARRIREASGAAIVLITLGERGMALSAAGRPVELIASRAREVYDVTGAGDTVLAYFGLGLAAGHDPRDAAEIANLAAGVKVGRVGTSAIAPSELTVDDDGGSSSRKHVNLSQAIARRERWRSLGKRVVFTNGCFDLLHAGHVHLLERARDLGDVLVVALNTDASVRRLKGPERPLVNETDRAKVMSALDAVDLVLLFDEDTPLELIRQLRPDVLAKGGDYSVATIVGADDVTGWGGSVATIPLVAGRSTTALLDSIRNAESPGGTDWRPMRSPHERET